jgi:hypothetical protein
VYLQVAGRLVDVPAALAEAVRSRAEISRRVREVLREISAINLELLASRSRRRCAMPRGGPVLRCTQGCSANSSCVIEAASHCWYCCCPSPAVYEPVVVAGRHQQPHHVGCGAGVERRPQRPFAGENLDPQARTCQPLVLLELP